MAGIFVVSLYMSALGCGGGGDESGSDGDNRIANIEVSDTTVVFGKTVLEHFSDREITVQNTGTSTLEIGSVAGNDGLSSPFTLLEDTCSGSELWVSEECSIKIRFQPIAAVSFSDTFDIPSNDPDDTMITVGVEGDGRTLNVTINQVELETCPEIMLYVSVTDKNDDFVTVLGKDNFLLTENSVGIETESVDLFAADALDVSVALVLDISGSVGEIVEEIKTAAQLFVDEMGDGDEATIFTLSDSVENVLGFTADKELISNTIDGMNIDWLGHTALFDGVFEVSNYIIENASNVRRAMIIITDGEDTASEMELPDTVSNAADNNLPIFTIGLGEDNVDVLEPLSDGTGGQYFGAEESAQLENIYLKIAQILSSQYGIRYQTNINGGNPVSLEVAVDVNEGGQELAGEDVRDFNGCD
jgi:VWFA-related protein